MPAVTLALVAAAAAVAAPADAADTTAPGDNIIVTGQRTDRSNAYTVEAQTSSFRFPISQRETPQSISVVTRQQIQDFQLNDFNALLNTVPGVQVQAAETDRIYYSARGFDIQTFQVDGIGLPFAFEVSTGSNDTAIYDHIEVIRGAPGLLSSTGNPSAVVNFIRKRPTRTFQATADAQYGSYDSKRVDGDVSVPLTRDGSLRARAVGAYVDNDSYLDRYRLRRWTGYGTIEADLGPNTTANVGYSYQNHLSHGATWGSMPVSYSDGTRIDLPRSANYAPDWSSWNVIDRQIFGDIIHHIGEDWTIRVTGIRRAISERDEIFYVTGDPDPVTGLGVSSYPGAFKAETRNMTVDANAAGKVTLFGRTHDVMFGVNRSAQFYRQLSSYDDDAIGVPLTLRDLYAGNFPKPNFPARYNSDPTRSSNGALRRHTRRETAYGMVRLSIADPLKLLAGVNVTKATSSGYSYGTPVAYSRTKALPFVGATFDVLTNLTVYASWAKIFNPQYQLATGGGILAPIEGDNLEAGVKGAWFGDRLNASLAVFQTRQKNTATADGYDPALAQTLYRGVDARSQGVEFEFGGEVLPGLRATGGYTLMRVKDLETRGPAQTFVPRNLGRLNLVYTVPPLPALKLGASAQYQSRIYNEPTSSTGVVYRIQQNGYATLDLLAHYDLTRNLGLSVNVRNVTNKKYLTALNYATSYYAAPRTVLGTISVRY